MSLRRFHGWEPRTFTVQDGRRTITVTEPEFDAWEQAVQVAYDDYQAGLCSDCGQPLSESLRDHEAEHHPTYLAGFTECRSCEALESAALMQARTDREQAQQAGEHDQLPPATHHRRWSVRRVDHQTK